MTRVEVPEGAEVVLVRHGETDGQSSIRYYGATDIPLSDAGREQMRRVSGALDGRRFNTVLTSPMIRARQSAELARPQGAPEPTVVPGFHEIDFGRWEGLTAEEIMERDGPVFERMKQGHPDFVFPGGDSRQGFQQRIARATIEAFREVDYPVLAVLHKGVIRIVMATLMGREPVPFEEHPIELGSIHRIRRTDHHWDVVEVNRVEHLDELRMPGS